MGLSIFGKDNPFKIIKRTMEECKKADAVLQAIADGLGYAPGISTEEYEEICEDLKSQCIVIL